MSCPGHLTAFRPADTPARDQFLLAGASNSRRWADDFIRKPFSHRSTALDIVSKKYERLSTRGRHLDRVQATIDAKLEAQRT